LPAGNKRQFRHQEADGGKDKKHVEKKSLAFVLLIALMVNIMGLFRDFSVQPVPAAA